MRRRQALSDHPENFAIVPALQRSIAREVAKMDPAPEDFRDWEGLADSALASCYEAEFGKKPHHRMKRETIVERLNDAANERA